MDENARQERVEKVKTRLQELNGPWTPGMVELAAIPNLGQEQLEAAANSMGAHPRIKAVDIDLLDLLLPGYRSVDSEAKIAFLRLADAPMYQPLPGPEWIRLLILEPARGNDDASRLRCQLRMVRLDDATGKYSALSYCWAQQVRDMRPGLSVICNGHATSVGSNLRLALEEIRYDTLPRIIWVDALCINQTDAAERAQQVKIMGRIYSQAAETIVWLGDHFPPGLSRPEFEAICLVVKNWDASLQPYYESRNERRKVHRHKAENAGSQWPDFTLVADVFRCPWFERRWVIQEVALARSVVVKVPGATIDWKWIGLAAGIIRTNYDRYIGWYQMPNLYNAYLISRLSAYAPFTPVDPSLLALLRLTTNFKTSQKPDMVYALLGLSQRRLTSSNLRALNLEVDYTMSESQIGIAVAEYHMQQPRRPLSFLSDAIGSSEKPTWSPRFNGKSIAMLDPWMLEDEAQAFSPAKGLIFKRFQSTDPGQLSVEGVQFSQVDWHSAAFGQPEAFDSIMGDLIRALCTCHWSLNVWRSSTLSAVARAFCGGRNGYGGRAEDVDDLAAGFNEFLRIWIRCHPAEFPAMAHKCEAEEAPFLQQAESHEKSWIDAAEIVCPGRCLFYTTSGHLGLGPGNAEVGDIICILGGTVMPTLVRPTDVRFSVVGDCYLDGIMHGEASSGLAEGTAIQGPFHQAVSDEGRRAQLRYEPLECRRIDFC